ncbi:Veg family protein [Bacillus paranthracis]
MSKRLDEIKNELDHHLGQRLMLKANSGRRKNCRTIGCTCRNVPFCFCCTTGSTRRCVTTCIV